MKNVETLKANFCKNVEIESRENAMGLFVYVKIGTARLSVRVMREEGKVVGLCYAVIESIEAEPVRHCLGQIPKRLFLQNKIDSKDYVRVVDVTLINLVSGDWQDAKTSAWVKANWDQIWAVKDIINKNRMG